MKKNIWVNVTIQTKKEEYCSQRCPFFGFVLNFFGYCKLFNEVLDFVVEKIEASKGRQKIRQHYLRCQKCLKNDMKGGEK